MNEVLAMLLMPFIYLAVIALAGCLIWLFRRLLRQLLTDLGVNNLKVAGIEITRSAIEIGNARREEIFHDARMEKYDQEQSQEIAKLARFVTPYITRSRVLWVDDNPVGNAVERRAFRLLGIE